MEVALFLSSVSITGFARSGRLGGVHFGCVQYPKEKQLAVVERRNDCRLQRGEGAIGGGAAVKREQSSCKGGGLNWRLATP
jgi:hypothetical protein